MLRFYRLPDGDQSPALRDATFLDQFGGFAAVWGLRAEVHHAVDTGLEEFRQLARASVATDDQFVVVNFLRSAIGEQTLGHISPLAAYDADTDQFLLLEVARYKYPPVWVSAAELFAAMYTTDSDNENRTRGFIIVTRGLFGTPDESALPPVAAADRSTVGHSRQKA
jgi:hypothetical protein